MAKTAGKSLRAETGSDSARSDRGHCREAQPTSTSDSANWQVVRRCGSGADGLAPRLLRDYMCCTFWWIDFDPYQRLNRLETNETGRPFSPHAGEDLNWRLWHRFSPGHLRMRRRSEPAGSAQTLLTYRLRDAWLQRKASSCQWFVVSVETTFAEPASCPLVSGARTNMFNW